MATNRYSTTDIVTETSSRKRTFKTKVFPEIPVSDSDIYIVTRDGDRLDIIANRVYQDSSLWWVIASANSIGDSLFITPGTKLRIPVDLNSALSYIDTVNEER